MAEQDLLDLVLKDLGFEPIQIALVEPYRWKLHERAGIGPEMIRIEKALRKEFGKPVDLRLEPKKDKNKRFDRNYLRGIEKL